MRQLFVPGVMHRIRRLPLTVGGSQVCVLALFWKVDTQHAHTHAVRKGSGWQRRRKYRAASWCYCTW